MMVSFRRTFPLLFAVSLLFTMKTANAADTAAELLPASTLIYLEINDPLASIDSFLNHSYVADLKNMEPYKEFEQSPQYLQGMTVLRVVEFQLGMTWRDAIKAISAGGVSLAFDPDTQGFAVLFKAEDSGELHKVRDKVVKMARDDAKNKGEKDPYKVEQYRDVDVYITKDGGFLTHDDWLIVGNKSDLGKKLIDALLDGQKNSFAQNKTYQTLRGKMKDDSVAWGFVNLEPLRHIEEEGLQKLFAGTTEEPAGEMLLGGVLEGIKNTPHVSFSLTSQANGLSLNLQMPHDPTQVSELREHYLGPQGSGRANPLQEVPDMLFGLSAYRDFSQMWLRAGDLFNAQVNDGIAQADSNLSTFFSGKDFGEDILGALSPQIQFIAARQNYPEDRPIPAIKIPAFALLAEMKDPESTTREFRRIYQSFIGFFNVIGAMEGNPQFDLDFESLENGELISAAPIPLVGEEQNKQAKINYNFSPTVAFVGDQLIISSASNLARSIAQSERPKDNPKTDINTEMKLVGPVLQSALADNKSHLIAQNMLKDGHTREEAEKQIGLLLEVAKLFDSASLKLMTNDSQMSLRIGVELKE
jgi:hypothetical protein